MSNAKVTPPEVEVEVEELPTNQPTSTGDGLVGARDLVEALKARRVVVGNAQALVAEFSPDRITAALAWFDEQSNDVGPGLLVQAIRVGRQPMPSPAVSRGEQIRAGWTAWARENLPEALYPDGSLHLGAHAALFRDGRAVDAVPEAQRRSLLRRGVAYWDKRYGPYPGEND